MEPIAVLMTYTSKAPSKPIEIYTKKQLASEPATRLERRWIPNVADDAEIEVSIPPPPPPPPQPPPQPASHSSSTAICSR
jgi:hypothetical protein